jgi:hypothetical protein
MRSAALPTPDTATTTKQTIAMVEYRARTTPMRPFSSVLRSNTSATSPPSHTEAPSRCRARSVTAASWPLDPAACPCWASGMSPPPASTVSATRAQMFRSTKLSTVTTAAISVVVSQARPSSVSVRKNARVRPNCSSRVTGTLATLRNVKKLVAAEATVQNPAPPAAMSMARSNSGRSRESAKQGRNRVPLVTAAPMLPSIFAIGSP